MFKQRDNHVSEDKVKPVVIVSSNMRHMSWKHYLRLMSRQRKLMAVILLLIIVVVVATVVLLMHHNNHQASGSSTRIMTTQQKNDIKQVNTLQNELQNKSLNNSQKAQIETQIGVVYDELNSPHQALTAYVNSATLNPTIENCSIAAREAQAVGNKTLAIKYYKQTLSMINVSNDPTANDDKLWLENTIHQLGG